MEKLVYKDLIAATLTLHYLIVTVNNTFLVM